MLVFGLTQAIKGTNKQYWGRELGMCWQRIITTLCEQACTNYKHAIREGSDTMCDLVVGKDAIDTKYRIGSGDSGTLKKINHYGVRLQELGYRPVLLVLRQDNLPTAISACKTGGWEVMAGKIAYQYVQDMTSFDLQSWLKERKHQFTLTGDTHG